MRNGKKSAVNSILNYKNKGWFTLVEIMFAVSIIAIMAIAALGYYVPKQQKARDQVRITRIGTFETAIESFRNEFYAYPIASSNGSASDFAEASGVTPEEAANYVTNTTVCSSRVGEGKSMATNKLWHWFGKYVTKTSSGDPKQDTKWFQAFMNDAAGPVEGIDMRDGIAYKGGLYGWEFKYEIVVPLELGNADARNDGGHLGDRFFEKGNLVATDNAIKTSAELSCLQLEGKFPFEITVKDA